MVKEKEDKLFGVEVVYNVNENKRTVACYFKCPHYKRQEDVWAGILNEMYNSLRVPLEMGYFESSYATIREYPKKFGLAKCSIDDVFDVEEGKRIAKKQLRDRINRCKLNFLDRVNITCNRMLTSFFNRDDKLYTKLIKSTTNYEE